MENALIAVLALLSIVLAFLFLREKQKRPAALPEENPRDEKTDMILREIHHRVKNNFQTVSSLLNLHTRYLSDDSAKEVLWEGQNRIKSMALIHQQLYERDSTTSVSMPAYVSTLLKELEFSYNAPARGIRLEAEVAEVHLKPDTAIPLGLIMHELVLNAFKYAFPGNRGGVIRTTLSLGKDRLFMSVSDDGVGLPEGMENPLQVKSSYGMRLVTLFAMELKGEIRYESREGTTAWFECPLETGSASL